MRNRAAPTAGGDDEDEDEDEADDETGDEANEKSAWLSSSPRSSRSKSDAPVAADDECAPPFFRQAVEDRLDEVLDIVFLLEDTRLLAQAGGAWFLVLERDGLDDADHGWAGSWIAIGRRHSRYARPSPCVDRRAQSCNSIRCPAAQCVRLLARQPTRIEWHRAGLP